MALRYFYSASDDAVLEVPDEKAPYVERLGGVEVNYTPEDQSVLMFSPADQNYYHVQTSSIKDVLGKGALFPALDDTRTKVQIQDADGNAAPVELDKARALVKEGSFALYQKPKEVDPFYQQFPYWIGPKPQSDISALEGGQQLAQIANANKQGRRGFGEAITELGLAQIPLIGTAYSIGTSIETMRKLPDTIQRLQTGGQVTDQELVDLNLFLADQQRKEQSTTAGNVADIIKNMPSFMVEFYLLGGLSGLAEKGAIKGVPLAIANALRTGGSKIAKFLVPSAVENFAAKKLATETGERLATGVVGKAITSLGKTVASAQIPERIIGGSLLAVASTGAQALANIAAGAPAMESRGGLEQKIQMAFKGEDYNAATAGIQNATWSALGDRWIEYVSEMSGGALSKLLLEPAMGGLAKAAGFMVGKGATFEMGKWIADTFAAAGGPAATRSAALLARAGTMATKAADMTLPARERFVASLGMRLARGLASSKLNPEAMWEAIKRGGQDGMIEEMAEERLGGFTRGLLGIQGDDASLANAWEQMWPNIDQLKAEAIAFAMPMVGVAGIVKLQNWTGGIPSLMNQTVVAADKTIHAPVRNGDYAADIKEAETVVDGVVNLSKLQPKKEYGFAERAALWMLNVARAAMTGHLPFIMMAPKTQAEQLDYKLRENGLKSLASLYENAYQQQYAALDEAMPTEEKDQIAEKTGREVLASYVLQARKQIPVNAELAARYANLKPGDDYTQFIESFNAAMREQVKAGKPTPFVTVKDAKGNDILVLNVSPEALAHGTTDENWKAMQKIALAQGFKLDTIRAADIPITKDNILSKTAVIELDKSEQQDIANGVVNPIVRSLAGASSTQAPQPRAIHNVGKQMDIMMWLTGGKPIVLDPGVTIRGSAHEQLKAFPQYFEDDPEALRLIALPGLTPKDSELAEKLVRNTLGASPIRGPRGTREFEVSMVGRNLGDSIVLGMRPDIVSAYIEERLEVALRAMPPELKSTLLGVEKNFAKIAQQDLGETPLSDEQARVLAMASAGSSELISKLLAFGLGGYGFGSNKALASAIYSLRDSLAKTPGVTLFVELLGEALTGSPQSAQPFLDRIFNPAISKDEMVTLGQMPPEAPVAPGQPEAGEGTKPPAGQPEAGQPPPGQPETGGVTKPPTGQPETGEAAKPPTGQPPTGQPEPGEGAKPPPGQPEAGQPDEDIKPRSSDVRNLGQPDTAESVIPEGQLEGGTEFAQIRTGGLAKNLAAGYVENILAAYQALKSLRAADGLFQYSLDTDPQAKKLFDPEADLSPGERFELARVVTEKYGQREDDPDALDSQQAIINPDNVVPAELNRMLAKLHLFVPGLRRGEVFINRVINFFAAPEFEQALIAADQQLGTPDGAQALMTALEAAIPKDPADDNISDMLPWFKEDVLTRLLKPEEQINLRSYARLAQSIKHFNATISIEKGGQMFFKYFTPKATKDLAYTLHRSLLNYFTPENYLQRAQELAKVLETTSTKRDAILTWTRVQTLESVLGIPRALLLANQTFSTRPSPGQPETSGLSLFLESLIPGNAGVQPTETLRHVLSDENLAALPGDNNARRRDQLISQIFNLFTAKIGSAEGVDYLLPSRISTLVANAKPTDAIRRQVQQLLNTKRIRVSNRAWKRVKHDVITWSPPATVVTDTLGHQIPQIMGTSALFKLVQTLTTPTGDPSYGPIISYIGGYKEYQDESWEMASTTFDPGNIKPAKLEQVVKAMAARGQIWLGPLGTKARLLFVTPTFSATSEYARQLDKEYREYYARLPEALRSIRRPFMSAPGYKIPFEELVRFDIWSKAIGDPSVLKTTEDFYRRISGLMITPWMAPVPMPGGMGEEFKAAVVQDPMAEALNAGSDKVQARGADSDAAAFFLTREDAARFNKSLGPFGGPGEPGSSIKPVIYIPGTRTANGKAFEAKCLAVILQDFAEQDPTDGNYLWVIYKKYMAMPETQRPNMVFMASSAKLTTSDQIATGPTQDAQGHWSMPDPEAAKILTIQTADLGVILNPQQNLEPEYSDTAAQLPPARFQLRGDLLMEARRNAQTAAQIQEWMANFPTLTSAGIRALLKFSGSQNEIVEDVIKRTRDIDASTYEAIAEALNNVLRKRFGMPKVLRQVATLVAVGSQTLPSATWVSVDPETGKRTVIMPGTAATWKPGYRISTAGANFNLPGGIKTGDRNPMDAEGRYQDWTVEGIRIPQEQGTPEAAVDAAMRYIILNQEYDYQTFEVPPDGKPVARLAGDIRARLLRNQPVSRAEYLAAVQHQDLKIVKAQSGNYVAILRGELAEILFIPAPGQQTYLMARLEAGVPTGVNHLQIPHSDRLRMSKDYDADNGTITLLARDEKHRLLTEGPVGDYNRQLFALASAISEDYDTYQISHSVTDISLYEPLIKERAAKAPNSPAVLSTYGALKDLYRFKIGKDSLGITAAFIRVMVRYLQATQAVPNSAAFETKIKEGELRSKTKPDKIIQAVRYRRNPAGGIIGVDLQVGDKTLAVGLPPGGWADMPKLVLENHWASVLQIAADNAKLLNIHHLVDSAEAYGLSHFLMLFNANWKPTTTQAEVTDYFKTILELLPALQVDRFAQPTADKMAGWALQVMHQDFFNWLNTVNAPRYSYADAFIMNRIQQAMTQVFNDGSFWKPMDLTVIADRQDYLKAMNQVAAKYMLQHTQTGEALAAVIRKQYTSRSVERRESWRVVTSQMQRHLQLQVFNTNPRYENAASAMKRLVELLPAHMTNPWVELFTVKAGRMQLLDLYQVYPDTLTGYMGEARVKFMELPAEVQQLFALVSLMYYHPDQSTMAGNWWSLIPGTYLARFKNEMETARNRFGVNGQPSQLTPEEYAALEKRVLNPRDRSPYVNVVPSTLVAKVAPETAITTPVTAKAPQAPINIWYGSNENQVLSNLYPRPFRYQDRTYRSVEHAYQSLKSGRFDQETWDKYQQAPSVAGLKIPGAQGTKTEGDWNIRLMESLIQESFFQNLAAAQALQATGNAPLTHTQDTGIWRQEFPRILMMVRDALEATEGDQAPSAQAPGVPISQESVAKTAATSFRNAPLYSVETRTIAQAVSPQGRFWSDISNSFGTAPNTPWRVRHHILELALRAHVPAVDVLYLAQQQGRILAQQMSQPWNTVQQGTANLAGISQANYLQGIEQVLNLTSADLILSPMERQVIEEQTAQKLITILRGTGIVLTSHPDFERPLADARSYPLMEPLSVLYAGLLGPFTEAGFKFKSENNHLDVITVPEKFRNLGIGLGLIQLWEASLEGQGISTALVTATKSAVPYWQRLGYTTPRVDEDGAMMSKRLAPITLQRAPRAQIAEAPPPVVQEAQPIAARVLNALLPVLRGHEGDYNIKTRHVYDDEGEPAIGPGYRLFPERKAEFEVTTGANFDRVRRGLEDLTRDQYERLLTMSAQKALDNAQQRVPDFDTLPLPTQVAIADLVHWSVIPKFPLATAALAQGDYAEAARQLRLNHIKSAGGKKRIESAARAVELAVPQATGAPSAQVASVSPEGAITLQMSWHDRLLNHPKLRYYDDGRWDLAKMLQEAGVPKDEQKMFLDYAQGKDRDMRKLLSGFESEVLAALTIEPSGLYAPLRDHTGAVVDQAGGSDYERLTVNQGQGEYQEYFIKTPFPVPGQHGAFVDPNLAGWFRVRVYRSQGIVEVQEIQSELFQKNKEGFEGWVTPTTVRDITASISPKQATFLNLMLKNQTWVPVFINAITQWAKNQGFTKVRFPTGTTAAKVEGHQALADQLTQLQREREVAPERYEDLPRGVATLADAVAEQPFFARDSEVVLRADGVWVARENGAERLISSDEAVRLLQEETPWVGRLAAVGRSVRTRAQIESEINRLKAQGIEKLAPIEAFYENRVASIVNKMGAVPVTDANGNTWREVSLMPSAQAPSAQVAAPAFEPYPIQPGLVRRIFEAIRRGNNNRVFSENETRNAEKRIRQALRGDEGDRAWALHNMPLVDRRRFQRLLGPRPIGPVQQEFNLLPQEVATQQAQINKDTLPLGDAIQAAVEPDDNDQARAQITQAQKYETRKLTWIRPLTEAEQERAQNTRARFGLEETQLSGLQVQKVLKKLIDMLAEEDISPALRAFLSVVHQKYPANLLPSLTLDMEAYAHDNAPRQTISWGDYDLFSHTITLRGGALAAGPLQFSKTLSHEILHALTAARLETDPEFRSRIQRIFNAAQMAMPANTYGMTNLDEFIAEAFTDRAFQINLAELPAVDLGAEPRPANMWRQFLRAITDTLSRLFGVESRTLLEQAMENIVAGMTPTRLKNNLAAVARQYSSDMVAPPELTPEEELQARANLESLVGPLEGEPITPELLNEPGVAWSAQVGHGTDFQRSWYDNPLLRETMPEVHGYLQRLTYWVGSLMDQQNRESKFMDNYWGLGDYLPQIELLQTPDYGPNYAPTGKTKTSRVMTNRRAKEQLTAEEQREVRLLLEAVMQARPYAHRESEIKSAWGPDSPAFVFLPEIFDLDKPETQAAYPKALLDRMQRERKTRELRRSSKAGKVIWTIPVNWIAEWWPTSQAYAKLLRENRLAKATGTDTRSLMESLDPQDATRYLLRRFNDYHREINKNAEGVLESDLVRYLQGYVPSFSGMGAVLSEDKDALLAIQEALLDARQGKNVATYLKMVDYATVASEKQGGPLAPTEAMLKTLFSLLDIPFTTMAAAKAAITSGSLEASHNIPRDATFLDVTHMLHELMTKQLVDRFLTAKQKLEGPLAGIERPLEFLAALNQLMSLKRFREWSNHTMPRSFLTAQDAFWNIGRLPRESRPAESLRRYVRDILPLVYKKIALTRMTVDTDGEGRPLVIPIPNPEVAGSIIPLDVWKRLAENLSRYLGRNLDHSKTPQQNILDLIAVGDLERKHSYQAVKSPIESISGFLAARKPEGEDNILDWVVGGEVTGLLKTILNRQVEWNIGNFDLLKWLGRINMGMKGAALSFINLFFPIAGLESVQGVVAGPITKPVKFFTNSLWNPKTWFSQQGTSLLSIWRMMRAQDPWLMDLVTTLQRYGLVLAGYENENLFGMPFGFDEKSTDEVHAYLKRNFGETSAKIMKMLATPGNNYNRWIWELFNVMKVFSAVRLLQDFQEAKGAELNPREIRMIVKQIDNNLGGKQAIDYSYLTPGMRQALNFMFFSWQWSFGAWDQAGGGILSAPFLKNPVTDQEFKFIFGRMWPAFAIHNLIMFPMLLQLGSWLLGLGDDDEKRKFDVPFTWQNEGGREFYADMTPLLRKFPWYKGDPTGQRRFYVRSGKQAYEIGRWFTQPGQSLLSKTSQFGRLAIELATGSSAGSEWDLGFKNEGLLGFLWTRKEGFSGSVLGTIGKKFLPFSLLAWSQSAEAAPLQLVLPVSKGMSQTKAIRLAEEILSDYAYNYDKIKASPRIKQNLEALFPEILDAAMRNGYDPKYVMDTARGLVLRDLYADFYKALNANRIAELHNIGMKIVRINGTVEGVKRSMKNKDDRYGKPATLTPEQEQMIVDAFQ